MAVFVLLFLFLIISPVVESSVSLSRPCSHGLHHLPLVPSAHALWQHLIHQWVRYPAGLASIHSSRGSRRTLPVLCVWYREGINIYITHVVTEPHQMFSLHSLMLHCTGASFSNNPGDNSSFNTYNYFKPQRQSHHSLSTSKICSEFLSCLYIAFLTKAHWVYELNAFSSLLNKSQSNTNTKLDTICSPQTDRQINSWLSTQKYFCSCPCSTRCAQDPFFALMKHTDKVIKKPAINIYMNLTPIHQSTFRRLQCSCLSSFQ